MNTITRERRHRQSRDRRRSGVEWVGGCLSLPFFVTDRPEPYRPTFAVWIELPEGFVVGQDMVMPEDSSGTLGRTLLTAMERPLVGPARRPARIRVGDASLVRELRDAVGEEIPVEVAPTPELDELLGHMIETLPHGDVEASYLENGRIPAKTVSELFSAARILYTIKPWKVAHDSQPLRMDIPSLGVEGACVAIIGALGESLGLLIFPDLEGYEAFASATPSPQPERRRVDMGTEWLALTFERGSELSPMMRREVAEHDWPVESADAYPVLERLERDGASRPLVERDVQIAAASAASLSSFFSQNSSIFESDAYEPVSISYFNKDDLEVRFTVPYEALGEFEPVKPELEPAPAPRFQPRAARNAPCPCGSGKKYKKCHRALDQAEHETEVTKLRLLDLDARTIHELAQFAIGHFGDRWQGFQDDFGDVDHAAQLAVPWSIFGFRVMGQTVVDAYLESHGARCSPAERTWLAAQQAAWLSVWEVTETDPGRSVSLRDLLSGEVRSVQDVGTSRSLVARDAILARVVDSAGISIFSGMHPHRLPPFEAAEVVRRARGRLRRKRAVPVERLRDHAFGRYLIRRWEEALADLMDRASIPPDLRNTDGDPLLMTTDQFQIESGERAAVETCLAGMEDVSAPEPDENDYVFLGPGDSGPRDLERLVIGRAWLSRDVLHVEANSVERADALRERVEQACEDRIHHRGRVHADPRSALARGGAPAAPPRPAPPEAQQLLLEHKERHYADWPDTPLPALAGATPREAARTAQGRRDLDLLLRDMENREARMPDGTRFDFATLRRKLGVEEV